MPPEDLFPEARQRLNQFLQEHFQSESGEMKSVRLAGDASIRQYYRCISPRGKSYIAVSYPEPIELGSFTYRQIYDLFREIGIPVPATFAMNQALGIVLQEDLGDELLLNRLEKVGPLKRQRLLSKAVDYILRIQAEGSAKFDQNYDAYELAFDREKLNWELRFFGRHYLGGISQAAERVCGGLLEEYDRLAAELADFPRVLCHRDFQVRNIICAGEVLYVIDFQDARWGPPSYDLASLLKDSIDLDARTVNLLIEYYLRESRSRQLPKVSSEVFSEEAFARQFHLMCIQRLLKALGTYGYQVSVRQKTVYLQYVKGTLQRVLASLREIGEFPAVQSMVEEELSRCDWVSLG